MSTVRFIVLLVALVSLDVCATELYGDALLRYEDDNHLRFADRRERIRFTGHLGLRDKFNEHWRWDFRLSTGLRDKQNVPTITLKQFTDQAYPDRTVYIDRSYAQYQSDALNLYLGKIPWQLKRNTPIFWDSDLHPYGISVVWHYDANTQIDAAVVKPLDGQTRTTGTLSYISLTYVVRRDRFNWSFSPWYAAFSGDKNTRYANRDVEFDNRSARFSTTLVLGLFKLGVDYGRAINSFDVSSNYYDEKAAWVAQLVYGQLKKTGDWKLMARQLYIERFGVIEEFAQNSTSRFATSNYKGYELRLRRQMGRNWWLGTRFADTKNIKPDTTSGKIEAGRRFRVEAKYSF